MIAQLGDTVKVHYVGSFTDGFIFDKSEDPFEFELGEGQVIDGFEEAILGMKKGEKKSVTIPVEKAYGKYLDEYVVAVGRDKLPQDLIPEIGLEMQMPMPDGASIDVIIVDFTDDTITLDANHPLAGKELKFDLELLGILRS